MRQDGNTVSRWYPFTSMDSVRRANSEGGWYFFSVSTLRFFHSRVSERLYGGRYFVTSERGPDEVRRYTVREALPTGDVVTVGTFQAYASASGAHAACKRLAGRRACQDNHPAGKGRQGGTGGA